MELYWVETILLAIQKTKQCACSQSRWHKKQKESLWIIHHHSRQRLAGYDNGVRGKAVIAIGCGEPEGRT